MKINFTLLLIPAFSFFGYAQDVKLVSDTGNSITITNTAGEFNPRTKIVDGRAYQDFSKSSKVLTMQKDAPALPVFAESVIVPNEGNVSLQVQYDSYEEFENIEVLPSKGSLKRNVKPSEIAYSFGEAYVTDAFYPGELATLSSPYIIRDVRGATISFYPYQYNPVTKVLRVYENLAVSVVTDTNTPGINELKRGTTRSGNTFNQIYQNQFLNADDYQQVPENGEMLIISPNEYLDVIDQLADWKIEKGIKTTVVTLSEAGFTPTAIRLFIKTFYETNPGLTYVLLVGDHENLPTNSYGVSGAGEELWSDSYYAQLEGEDFFPEVLVGRFSGNVTEVSLMVSRTLEYEVSPMAGDWMTKTIGMGSVEGEGYGDDGEPDWQHLRGIGDSFMANGYTYVHEFYDGSQGLNDADGDPDPGMIGAALNDGAGLLNYCGHGAQDLMVTGWYTSDDADNLQNNGKYPFVVSVACNNGTFASGTSLCEVLLTSENNGSAAGAIAAAGSSILMAWAEPMQAQDEIASLITGGNPMHEKSTLGGLFYNGLMSVLEDYSLSPTAIEVMQTWVFFGDPSVVYRNSESQEIVATHVPEVDPHSEEVTVTCNVEGAVVSITQNGIIIGTGVVIGGEVIVDLGTFTPGYPLTVTVTGQNHTPYQGTIATGELGSGNFEFDSISVYPNPAAGHVTVKIASGETIKLEMRDVTGKLVYESGNVSLGTAGHTINTSTFSSGVYLLTASGGERRIVKKVIIR
jgi:gingipain R